MTRSVGSHQVHASHSRPPMEVDRPRSPRPRGHDRRPGLLVVADSWMPGWTARVDGVPVPILRGNHAQRSDPTSPTRPAHDRDGLLATGIHSRLCDHGRVGIDLGSIVCGFVRALSRKPTARMID